MAGFFDDPLSLAPRRVEREARPDGSFVLRSPQALGPYSRCVGEWLERWAVETPTAPALAERAGEGWRQLDWRSLRQAVGSVAQTLLDLSLPPGRPVVVLSDNAIDHAVLMLAALHIGRPACTVSSAYCRLTRDHARIHAILRLLQPAVIHASDAAVYGPAISTADVDAVTVFSHGAGEVRGAQTFADWLKTPETPAVRAAFESVHADHVAKYLLTSGSTGLPKVVVNTQRMLCANQQMIAQAWRFLAREKPVLLDWLPWSHTFGGNHNLNLVLCHGGTLYIDDGRPMPGLIEKTVANLKACEPTLHFNVPRGLDMLLPFLEGDEAFARRVLGRLRMVFYAGAALPPATWERLQAVARRVRDQPLWLTTAWGSTETAPAVTSAHWQLQGAGCIGLPLPGAELKFVPNGAKLEMRVRGEAVFPGYRNAPELTAQAFDDEGFYRIGDAGRLVDDDRPEAGVLFDGRVAEDFKLTTGTWVPVGAVRVALVSALSPLVQDAVITGHDRDEAGALVFLSAAGAGLPDNERRTRLQAGLERLLHDGGANSTHPTRLLVLAEPPSVDAGEITDKGYLNQRAVLQRRAADVRALYEAGDDPRVVRVG